MLLSKTARGLKALSINYDEVLAEAYAHELQDEIELGESFSRDNIARYLCKVKQTIYITLNVLSEANLEDVDEDVEGEGELFKCLKKECRDYDKEFSEAGYKLHISYKLHTEGNKKKLRSRVKKNH